MIAAPGTQPPRIDERLIRSIAKGYAWLQDLKAGRLPSLSAIANREGVKRPHIGHLINLAFLAPEIVDAVLLGTQPIDLSTDRLLKALDIDLAWPTQRHQLGFRT